MADETLPAEILSDLSDQDKAHVKRFVEDGLPGIDKVDNVLLYRLLDLYLSGQTYGQISNITRTKKVLVMYLSQRHDWLGAKQAYLADLSMNLTGRIVDAKLVNKDFLLTYVKVMQKKYGKRMSQYLATEDEAHLADMDQKELAQLLKVIEAVNQMDKDPKSSQAKGPMVNVNVGSNVTIEKTGENKLTIATKENTIGDMLKKFADQRREDERKAKPEKERDIKDNTQGEIK